MPYRLRAVLDMPDLRDVNVAAHSKLCPALLLKETAVLQSTDKELVLYPNRWHVLLKEEDGQKVIEKVVNWISQRAQ